jgi:predicted acyl esterase
LALAGDAIVHADLRFSGEWAHLIAVLLDITPDGVAREIRTGRRLVVGPDRALTTVELGPVAYHLPAGHRLALRLSSSWFPRYALDSGNSTISWAAWNPRSSSRRVILGGPTGARLTCGVLQSRGGGDEGVPT